MQRVPRTITVLGDSHAVYFIESPFFAGRLGLSMPLRYRISGSATKAASVAGFRPGASTLKVKDKIRAVLPACECLVLAFGQVDLELGYYFRRAIKQEDRDPAAYVAWLIGIYSDFIADLPVGSCRLALKGVNLTALAPRPFAARYVARIAKEGTTLNWDEAQKRVEPFILSERDQNAMHLSFNDQLAQLAAQRGFGYFDVVAQTGNGSIPGISAEPLRLAEQFRTGGFDHHMADTVVLRRIHYEAAGRAFSLV